MAASELITDGVHRVGTRWVAFYLLAGADGVTVVDCGFPRYHGRLLTALAEIGRPLDSVNAIVLTHHHADHVGSAERIRAETGATVYVPAGDAQQVGAGKVSPPKGLMTSGWRPRMARYLSHAALNGGARLKPVAELRTYQDGDVLADAGGLRAVHAPGHTFGQCALLAEEAGVLFAGDALATFDFVSGRSGPCLLPFHDDAALARESLSKLEPLAASRVAVGHGDTFEGTPAEAVRAARAGGNGS